MPRYTCYIARADAPLDRLVPSAWHDTLGFGIGWLKRKAEEGAGEVRIDWGAWGVEASRSQCLSFWDERRAGAPQARWSGIRDQIAALPASGRYVVVVMEAV